MLQAEDSLASLDTAQLVENFASVEAQLASNAPELTAPDSVASDHAILQPTQAGMCTAVVTSPHQGQGSHAASPHTAGAAVLPDWVEGEGTVLTRGVAAEIVETEQSALKSHALADCQAAVCPQRPHNVIAMESNTMSLSAVIGAFITLTSNWVPYDEILWAERMPIKPSRSTGVQY